jgi:hypothetical protein
MAVIKIVPMPGPAGTGGSGDTGDITFDGIQIIGAGTASGDGANLGTIELVPDGDLASDQYLIIDPTGPNHIHIRAGGEQDNSGADLILGGETNNVWVSDGSRRVSINTRPETVINSYVNDNLTSSTTFVTNNTSDINIGYVVNIGGTAYVVDEATSNSPTQGLLSVTASGAVFTSGSTYTFVYEPEYTNYWQFGADGYLTGPAMGGLFVNGLLNGEGDLWLGSSTNVVLNSGEGGQFLDDPNNPDNQIATIGDIQSGTTGDITFDGVKIIGAGAASGDGYGNGTIELIPDAELITNEYQEDQYLIIDPTQPNHIHIRPGGTQDDSTADLFIGAERTHVRVSDSGRTVEVQAKKDETSWTYPNIDPAGGVVYVVDSDAAEPDYNDFMIVDGTKYVITSVTRDLGNTYYETTPSFTFAYNESYTFTRDNGSHAWKFGDYGVATLTLPSENPTIINNAVPGDITLSAYLGVNLAFATSQQGAGLKFPDDTVQTTAYAGGATGSFVSSDNKTVTVTNGIIVSIEEII